MPVLFRIDGTSKNVDGRDAAYQMAGRFWDKMAVKLGHLRTDDAGRLLVFPADGVRTPRCRRIRCVTSPTTMDGTTTGAMAG